MIVQDHPDNQFQRRDPNSRGGEMCQLGWGREDQVFWPLSHFVPITC